MRKGFVIIEVEHGEEAGPARPMRMWGWSTILRKGFANCTTLKARVVGVYEDDEAEDETKQGWIEIS